VYFFPFFFINVIKKKPCDKHKTIKKECVFHMLSDTRHFLRLRLHLFRRKCFSLENIFVEIISTKNIFRCLTRTENSNNDQGQ
jgi:hypothetical protein